MQKVFSILSSTRLMAFLFIVFAVAMAAGTFIENEYNTDTARIWVYNAWWFETIMVFFAINFFGNIKRYRLWSKEKWPTLVLHLSFLFILFGAFITRYISNEGTMGIREGESSTTYMSDKVFLQVKVDGDYQGEMRRRSFEKPLILSPVANNHFEIRNKFNDIPFEIVYKDYVMNAVEQVEETSDGTKYLKFVESSTGERHEHFLEEGKVVNVHNILFSFNNPTEGAINIISEGDSLKLESPFGGDFMRMADQSKGLVYKDSIQPLAMRSLYNVAGMQFVFPEPVYSGVKTYVSNGDFKDRMTEDALTVIVRSGGEEKELTLMGDKGRMGIPQSVKVGDLDFMLFFGSKSYEIPFTIKLNDFIAERYPGTINNYSSFESQVTVIDGESSTDHRIYMNNILNYRGYRFFQASYDQDELGTLLSVNHDFWGTNISYLGYILLYISMIWILFDKNSRFGELKVKLRKLNSKKSALSAVVLFLFSFGVQAQDSTSVAVDSVSHAHTHQMSTPVQKPSPDEFKKFVLERMPSHDHASKFGQLVIQDEGGRMKPINTFSSELLRKVSKKDHFEGYSSDQVFLSMSQYPYYWMEVPLVYLKRGNDSLRKIINLPVEAKYAPFINFFDDKGNYLLGDLVDEATRAAVPNQFQKDFIEINKRVVLLNSAFSGAMLRLFPIPGDENNKWISYLEMSDVKNSDIQSIKNIVPLYMQTLDASLVSKDYSSPDQLIDGISKFQHSFGKDIMPSDSKIKYEILYNKYDVFKKLYYLYMLTGLLMLIVTIVQIFKSSRVLAGINKVLYGVIVLYFILHTLGLAARWYISGHAPWSDAYESMIYVAWATVLFSIFFDRKSMLTVASGTFVSSMILMIAHWNFMDPAISNLVPVLNSYWLMIHVAVIVASYGPFTLGMILGVVSLLLMIMTTSKNKERMKINIQEITYINEMALTIGLVLLTIGNFLGGMWANESWGRYWSWDPKETWALISIMVYAFVIHMRFVPAFRGLFVFNFAAIISFYSILMTYFGVNFYLSGLHSYASGDKVITPSYIYISVVVIFVLGIIAYFQYKKHYKK